MTTLQNVQWNLLRVVHSYSYALLFRSDRSNSKLIGYISVSHIRLEKPYTMCYHWKGIPKFVCILTDKGITNLAQFLGSLISL